MANQETQNWRALCKAVTAEQDSQRLQCLLAQLLKSLDEPGMAAIQGRIHPTAGT